MDHVTLTPCALKANESAAGRVAHSPYTEECSSRFDPTRVPPSLINARVRSHVGRSSHVGTPRSSRPPHCSFHLTFYTCASIVAATLTPALPHKL